MSKLLKWYMNNKQVVWAGIKFVVYLGAFFILLSSRLGEGELIGRFNAVMAIFTGAILNMMGVSARADGPSVIGNLFSIQIANGCNGVHVTALVTAAMLAAPTGWMYRALGIAFTAIAIYVLNLGRAVSLFVIGSYRPQWFNFAHVYAWETVVVLSTLAIFMAWAGWSIPKGRQVSG